MLTFLEHAVDFYWQYIGATIIILFGVYATIKTRGFQFYVLKKASDQVKEFITHEPEDGVHPLKLYFASVGGSIGLGNIILVTTALTLGGPGSLFWLWVSSAAGMLVKYSEIYLSILHRQRNKKRSYNGGAMYFAKAAFGSPVIGVIVAIFFCIYGCEVYQFSVIVSTIHKTYNFDKTMIALVILGLTFYAAHGGIRRLSTICSFLMPIFLIFYIALCFYVIGYNYAKLPEILSTIFKSAFTGHAAIGGFAGVSILGTIQHGVSSAVYSGDIGIGYDGIIQAETSIKEAAKQARFSILSLFTDSFICTLSILVVLCSGLWNISGIPSEQLVTQTFCQFFPFAKHFMAVLLFLAGFTTVISFLTVGFKTASYISEKFGKIIYTVYTIPAFIFFSFSDPRVPMLAMSLCAAFLLTINMASIFKLRSSVKFK